MHIIAKSEEETKQFGEKIAENLNGGDILLLNGELGAGKTTLAKGLAKKFGIDKEITSPTFSLMNIYPTKSLKIKRLIHIDTYRLKNEQELIDIGAEDYLGQPENVCIIEWPEKIKNLLKNKKCTSIKLEHSAEHSRLITID